MNTTSPIAALDSAEAKHAEARAYRAEIEKALAKLDKTLATLDGKHAAALAALDAVLADEALLIASRPVVGIERREAVDACERQLAEARRTKDALTARLEPARSDERRAADAVERVKRAMARELVPIFRQRAIAAWRAWCTEHAAWLSAANTAQLPATGSHASMGDRTAPESYDGIARDHGVNVDSYGIYGSAHTMTADDLRRLVTEHDITEIDVPPAPQPARSCVVMSEDRRSGAV